MGCAQFAYAAGLFHTVAPPAVAVAADWPLLTPALPPTATAGFSAICVWSRLPELAT